MDEALSHLRKTAIVVIGRNEGERLKRCLRSLPTSAIVIYVDSGSTDGSVAFARSCGFRVAELDMRVPFTAARARNVGLRALLEEWPGLEFVQFVDGDCELHHSWIAVAVDRIRSETELAATFGRLRERFPDRSIYNKMCDDEWNVPAGLVDSCGGIALFRVSALQAAGGFAEDLIAGEEPDLCLRLRRAGWSIRCLETEMALHDAAILTFSANWKRTMRSGFAYAEHIWRHGHEAIPAWRRQLLGIILWGGGLPSLLLIALVGYLLSGATFLLLIAAVVASAYPIQFGRVAFRKARATADWKFGAAYGAIIVSGKFAQAIGATRCWAGHLQGRLPGLIEYKRS